VIGFIEFEEPIGSGSAVGIHKGNPLRLGFGRRKISGATRAHFSKLQKFDALRRQFAVFLNPTFRIIRRRVIDYQGFKIGMSLIKQTLQTFVDKLGFVVRRNDDRDL